MLELVLLENQKKIKLNHQIAIGWDWLQWHDLQLHHDYWDWFLLRSKNPDYLRLWLQLHTFFLVGKRKLLITIKHFITQKAPFRSKDFPAMKKSRSTGKLETGTFRKWQENIYNNIENIGYESWWCFKYISGSSSSSKQGLLIVDCNCQKISLVLDCPSWTERELTFF